MRSLSKRAIVYGLVILLGLLSTLPSFLPDSTLNQLPQWYQTTSFKLGLDLRGGSHLLLEVDSEALLKAQHQQLAELITDNLREARLFVRAINSDQQQVEIYPRDLADLSAMKRLIRPLIENPEGGLPLYRVEARLDHLTLLPTEEYINKSVNEAVEKSLQIVRKRLDESGLVEPGITRHGKQGIQVQLPGVDDPKAIRDLLGTTASMTFHWVVDELSTSSANILQLTDPSGQQHYRIESRIAMEGEHIRDARMAFSQETGQPVVSFTLDKTGARQFADMTTNNIDRQLAIVLDDQVITAPSIRSVIGGGRGEISGQFTLREASQLALLLRSGALPAPLLVIEERTVGPDLGSDAIQMGLFTGITGAVLVLFFMVAIYGVWGLIACIGLLVNLLLIFAVFSLLGATLTLPGIAGIILSIGMAVDANILINERIREEIRRGKKAWHAIDSGFRRAYSTILDSNITSLIAVSLLFMFGSGPVRGFAVAIAIGLLTSLFTSISLTRLLMEWRARKHSGLHLSISGIKALDRLSRRTINFMRSRKIGLAASALLSIASIGLFISPGLNYGIDFSGGIVVESQIPGTDVDQVRLALNVAGLDETQLQEFGDAGHYLLRLPMKDAQQIASGDQLQQLKQALTALSDAAEFPRVEMVGPKVSGDFSDATILAIVFAGLGMLAYLWVRFEFHFALAATTTIALDLTKTIGFFALTGIEFNLTAVAALLALIGYSVNDKVVVFDRIRENLRATPDKPLMQLLNESISATLTRTVFTSVTTLLALLPMAIAGGHAVASFAIPMIFGIIIGTSSSVLIASPLVLLLGQRRMQRGLAQLRPSREEMQKKLDAIL